MFTIFLKSLVQFYGSIIEDAKWLTKEKLYSVKWLPADMTLIAEIEKQMK